MRRSSVLFVVLIAMLWQSLALARSGSVVNPLADFEHASLHWQEQAHHHHADGSCHLDDSGASAQHMAVDHVSSALVMKEGVSHQFALVGTQAPQARHERAPPHPILDGLLRPPRAHA